MHVYAELFDNSRTVEAANLLLALLPEHSVVVDANLFGSVTLQLVAALDGEVRQLASAVVVRNVLATI